MTPEQIDTVTNGLINLHTFVSDWWPAIAGLGLTASALVFLWRHARRRGRDDQRTRNDRVAAQRITRTQGRPEPAQPGQDGELLAQCHAICPELARKEGR